MFVCSRADFARSAGGCRRGSVIAHGVGVGLRSAVRVSEPAYLASWMDTMPVIRKRHPEIAERLVAEFERGPHTPFLPQLMHNEASREPRGLNHPAGRQRHWEHVRCQQNLMTSNQVVCVRVGNMKPALGWSNSSDRSCSEGSPSRCKL